MLIAAAWLALATAGSAGAQPAPQPAVAYELHWTRAPGAESCIDARELARAVSAWLGRQVFEGEGGGTVVIDGRIEPTAAGWTVAIAIRDPDGVARGAREIELDGADCRAIDESLVLVLGLIVDPDGGGPPVPRVTIRNGPPVAPPEPAWRFEASLSGAAGLGVLPGGRAGARLSVGVDPPRMWPIAIGLGWWPPGETAASAPDRRVSLSRWQASAVLSTPVWRRGRLRLSLNGGGMVAQLAARGLGFDRDRDVRATIGIATLAGRAAFDLVRTAFVTADVGAEVPLTRPRFSEDDGTLVYRVAPASIVATLGVGVRF